MLSYVAYFWHFLLKQKNTWSPVGSPAKLTLGKSCIWASLCFKLFVGLVAYIGPGFNFLGSFSELKKAVWWWVFTPSLQSTSDISRLEPHFVSSEMWMPKVPGTSASIRTIPKEWQCYSSCRAQTCFFPLRLGLLFQITDPVLRATHSSPCLSSGL